MPVTTRYLLSQTTKPLLAAMSIGLMVMLAERMVRLLDITLGKKNSFSMVFEMLGYLVPHYLGLALPAAFFLGLLFGFNRLSKESEIDAYMAAGIGLHQLARPFLVLAVFFVGAAVIIIGFIQPHTRYAYRAIVHTVKNVEVFNFAEEGVFLRNGPRTFILQKLSRKDNVFEQIFLYNDKGVRGSETITARGGSLIEVAGRQRPVLRLRTGHRLEVLGKPGYKKGTALPRVTASAFGLVDTPLGSDSPVFFRPRGHDERELTLPELYRLQNTPPKWTTKPIMRAELHRRIISILTILILPILAIPFALGRKRGQRSYRFGAALILLIVFHETIEQGALAMRYQNWSPYLAMWTPFLLLTTFAGWRFYKACFSIRSDSMESVIDRINDAVKWVLASLFKIESSR
jgi:lipopolysaccharide export system permease protein